jgi:hypothetical protein
VNVLEFGGGPAGGASKSAVREQADDARGEYASTRHEKPGA